jgi:hypothetical protein
VNQRILPLRVLAARPYSLRDDLGFSVVCRTLAGKTQIEEAENIGLEIRAVGVWLVPAILRLCQRRLERAAERRVELLNSFSLNLANA